MSTDFFGLQLAMEWGFRAAEKGMNLQRATREFADLMKLTQKAQDTTAQSSTADYLKGSK